MSSKPTTQDRSVNSAFFQSGNEDTLVGVRRSDRAARDANGRLARLTVAEHFRRASIYFVNRAFEEAREHWQAIIDLYPQDRRVAEALLGIGRSYFQSRQYDQAYSTFNRLALSFSSTKEGREGLNFSAAALLRLGRASEAADRYAEYIDRFPAGERIDTAHLNVIDAFREACRPQDAIVWIARTRARFVGTATETNALFARLRLDLAEADWRHAVSSADLLSRRSMQKGVMTTATEVAYLRAYSLERAGDRENALTAYLAIPDTPDSYYGWLATQRLQGLADRERRERVNERPQKASTQIASTADLYPAPYKQAILRAAKARQLDPRFVLALIRQESVFRSLAKSPSGARGLLQLTIDLAQKYAASAGVNKVRESELYRPETSILLGSEYLAQLFAIFPNMPEAVAASYNGGEDNVERWVRRAQHKDPGIFTAEIGFEETKAYVQKVMANYRAYLQLYTTDLVRK